MDTYGLSIRNVSNPVEDDLRRTEGGIFIPPGFRDIDIWKDEPDTAIFSNNNRKNPPLSEEAQIEIWEDPNIHFWRTIKNPSNIIQKEEFAKALRILDEMITRDTDISTALVDRALVISSLDHEVLSADPDDKQLRDMADLFKSDIEDIDLPALVGSFTYDLYYGFGIREIPWFWKNQDHWAFKDLDSIPQWAWTFHKETGRPHLLPDEQDQSGEGLPITPGRFLYTLRRHPTNGKNPYGMADGLDVYYPARWRNWTIRALLSAAAKVGGTIVIGKYPEGVSEDQKQALLEVSEAVQNGQAIVIPEKQSIDIPENSRVSIKDFFTAVDDLFARMIKKRLTGAEFSTGRGAASPTGTLAETKVHAQVSDAWKEGAAKYVIQAMNHLARMWTDFNFGHEIPAPRFELDFEGREDQKLLIETIDIATTIIPLKEEEVYKRLGWTMPGPGDETTGVRQKPSPFGNSPSFLDMAPPSVGARRALPEPKSDNNPDDLPDAEEKEGEEFHDHHHERGKPIGQAGPELFAELEALGTKWEQQQEILTGKILADARVNPDSYPVFMNELREDLSARKVNSYDAARKAVGISAANRATFRDYIKGAMASVFTLHSVQQLNKFTKDVAENFSESDIHILYTHLILRGGDKTVFQEPESIDFLPFEEAMEILRLRSPNLSPQFYDLVDNNLHGWAFTVSNLESQKTVQAVLDSLIKAEEEGKAFSQWRNDIDEILSTEDIEKLKPGQLETVFRTNLQTAYNAAGERLVNEVDPTGDLYPAYQFLNGDPVSTICIPRDGKVFPRSDTSNIPPLHFNCKSYIIWLSKFETFDTLPETSRDELPPPGKGFSRSPATLLNAGIE